MTFDLRAERSRRTARKFAMAGTVYDCRFLQSNLFDLIFTLCRIAYAPAATKIILDMGSVHT